METFLAMTLEQTRMEPSGAVSRDRQGCKPASHCLQNSCIAFSAITRGKELSMVASEEITFFYIIKTTATCDQLRS